MSLKSIEYAVDFDFYNLIKLKTINEYKTIITRLISNLETIINMNVIITDIKFGVNNNIYNNKFKDYKDVYYYIQKNKYIENKSVLNQLYKKIKGEKDIVNIFNFLDEYRKSYTLRWSIKDLVKQFKMVDGVKKTLNDCLYDPVIFKIDLLAQTRGGLEEISIVYQFEYNKQILNGTKIDFNTSIKKDITILYKTDKYYKCLKRLFSYNLWNDKQYEMNKLLVSFFNSNSGILYKVIQDMNQIIENIKEIKKDNILFELDIIKKHLNNIYEYDNKLIDKITERIYLLKNKPTKKKETELKEIINIFNDILKKHTLKFIHDNNLVKYIENLFIKPDDLLKFI
jgi:hypothetical protein